MRRRAECQREKLDGRWLLTATGTGWGDGVRHLQGRVERVNVSHSCGGGYEPGLLAGEDGETERKFVVESEMEVKLALKLRMSNDRVAGLVAGRELNATLRPKPGLSSPRLVNSLGTPFHL